MTQTDWWNDLYNETDTQDIATGNLPEAAEDKAPAHATAPSAEAWWTATPAHQWGSANRPVDPFLSQNPAPGQASQPVSDGDNTAEEIAELARHAKDGEKPEEKAPGPLIPPMPTQAPDVAPARAEPDTGVKALLKEFRRRKNQAVKDRQEAVADAAALRSRIVAEATAKRDRLREEAERAAKEAALLKADTTENGRAAYARAVENKRAIRKEFREASKEVTEVIKTAKATERNKIQEANNQKKAADKEATAVIKDKASEKTAPIREAQKNASAVVTRSFDSGWSFFWPLGFAQAVPVTFPLSLLDRLVMIFGSPRPLSGTEPMAWNFLHGPGVWFGDQLKMYGANGEIGRVIALCAVGAVPVMFAQLGERIVKDWVRKALGWFSYLAPAFFICMPYYFHSLGFHQVSDLYISALAALSWWGLSFSRTMKAGFLQAVLRIPVAAMIVGFGHYAPGAAF
jgi:hypothetical protein